MFPVLVRRDVDSAQGQPQPARELAAAEAGLVAGSGVGLVFEAAELGVGQSPVAGERQDLLGRTVNSQPVQVG